MPMQSLVDKIPLIELVKSALCGSPNIFRNCLQLAIAFEKGDWSSISTLSSSLKLSENDLHSHYHYAIRWASALEQSVKREE
jgi:EAL and modified HD-GYP domain-containing signal transduction protein